MHLLVQTQKLIEISLIVKIKTYIRLDLPFILRIFMQVTHKNHWKECLYVNNNTRVCYHGNETLQSVAAYSYLVSVGDRRASCVRDGGRLARNAGRYETYTSRTRDVTARSTNHSNDSTHYIN